ncbi:MAG: hypothetical protein M2R45_02349 [Verrucomicrobia subdivision 3 bacterium]|nr:hypothetical protein [Limisphaerales bacterium]MCS1414901.1 hypothetical protein [Limisphaerales bacterium]
MPIFYECDRCTACCRWPDVVKVTAEEIEAITAYWDIPTDQFINEST